MLLVDVIAWLKEEFIKVCKSGNAKKVEATIMNGANVNIKSGYGYSALMYAVLYGHTETANLLRSYGAK